jgi:hypothetical protein
MAEQPVDELDPNCWQSSSKLDDDPPRIGKNLRAGRLTR